MSPGNMLVQFGVAIFAGVGITNVLLPVIAHVHRLIVRRKCMGLLPVAAGKDLDMLGRLFDRPRILETDEEYRDRLDFYLRFGR